MMKPSRTRYSSTVFAPLIDELLITPGKSVTVANGATIVICTWTSPKAPGGKWVAHLTIQAQCASLHVRLVTSDGTTHIRWLEHTYIAIDSLPQDPCRLALFREVVTVDPPVAGAVVPGDFEVPREVAESHAGKECLRWTGRSRREVTLQLELAKGSTPARVLVRVTSPHEQDAQGFLMLGNPVRSPEGPETLLCLLSAWDPDAGTWIGRVALSASQMVSVKAPVPDGQVVPASALQEFSEQERNMSFNAVLDTGDPVSVQAWVRAVERSDPDVWAQLLNHLRALANESSQRGNDIADLYGRNLEGLIRT
ncbi:MAG: hypothetical protein ACRD0K_20660 [Egibacteraceae bacterium]